MRPLDLKLVRDLSRSKGQIFSIAAVVAGANVRSATALRSEAASRVEQARVALDLAAAVSRRREALYPAGALSNEQREQAAAEALAAHEDLDAAKSRLAAASAARRCSRARGDRRRAVVRCGEDCAGRSGGNCRLGWRRPLAGTVRSVEPSAFTRVSALGVDEQRVNVIVDIVDPPASLGDGFRVEMKATVWESSDVLTIPASALFQRGGEWMVFVVRDGRARERQVNVGHRKGVVAELKGGLRERDRVILFPSDKVSDGVIVRS